MSTTSYYTDVYNGTTKPFQPFMRPLPDTGGARLPGLEDPPVRTWVGTGNHSGTDDYHPIMYERDFVTSAKVGTCLCILAIIVNLVLMGALFSSKKLRINYIYTQVLSISIADLSFVIMVDSFTVYYEVQAWALGAAFCKAWMLLDVALPAVSLNALVLLNVDRVLYTYCTSCYLSLARSRLVRAVIVITPWFLSAAVVCPIWLGFPAAEPEEGICIYGITKDANTVSNWLTIFIPSIAILVLLIFVFIAVIGEMPTVTSLSTRQNGFHAHHTPMQMVEIGNNSGPRGSELPPRRPEYEMTTSVTAVAVPSDDRRQRRFVAALLAVDFISLATVLPFSAFSMVSPYCNDEQSCDSLRTLFQTLSWMRSSVTLIRPLMFFLLTDLYRSFKYKVSRRCCGPGGSPSSQRSSFTSERRNSQDGAGDVRQELVSFAHVSTPRVDCYRSRDDSVTNCTIITPPESPYLAQTVNILNPRSGKQDFRVEVLFKEQDGTSV